jgi:glycosyltransferase involved in cell wall biosynthesis
MKLLIIHNKYQSNNIGGEDIVYKNELESLSAKLGKENVLSYEVSNDDISKLKLFFEIWFSFKHYQNIKEIVQKNNIDIVHIHNFFPLLTPSVFKAAKDGGAKVIHTLHNYRLWCISGILYRDEFGICEKCINHKFSLAGIFNKCYRKSLLQSVVAQMAFWFYKVIKVFDNIDYFFVLTNFQKEKIKSLGIDESKIILKPNSLNMSFVAQKEKKDYIYVGRLEESKGIYELLNVWNQLDERFGLTIIGGGDIEDELRAKYDQKNIIFKGKYSREETLENISKSKYLIQPSILYETFGLTIIEAMSFGVPVIGYDIGTRGDFIQDGVNGFLSYRDNLKSVIEKSYEHKEYDRLSNQAVETAKMYENEYVIEKQIEIYKNILGSTV